MILDLLRLRLWFTECGLPFGHGSAWLGKRNGARAKHSITDALIRMSLELEEAILSGQNVKGIAVDLSKVFDNVPEKITFAVLEKLGMHPKLSRALRGMYHQLQEAIEVRKIRWRSLPFNEWDSARVSNIGDAA